MKRYVTFFFMIFISVGISAKEMELWCNDSGASEFYMLTVEEQYNSYINSFKKVKDPR